MTRRKREEKLRERNVSAGYLLRMFQDHQLESLGDISAVYRKLERSLGYKTAQFEEFVNSSGNNGGAEPLFYAKQIIDWKKQCHRWEVDPDGTEILARDNATIEQIGRMLKMPRDRIILHAQCALTVWSVNTHRCNSAELHQIIRNLGPE